MVVSQQQKNIRLGARSVQFVSAIIGLATVAGGVSGGGSKSTIFGIIVNYTAMLYGLYATVAVEALGRAPRLPMMIDVAVDGLMVFLLFIAGIVVATCDAYKYCDADDEAGAFGSDEVLHCGSLGAGIAFTFIGMIGFIVTIALTLVVKNNTNEVPEVPMVMEVMTEEVYVASKTPSGELSPIGVDATTPNAKV
ncbi:hypothetical protein PINS_up010611 [Pythium insidiosum]|nr:hypothetical protein PINS_up010611 [Pythium insidiosum]